VIGQQADALLVGDAKQRSALYAFPRDTLLVDPGGVVVGAFRVAACSTFLSASARCSAVGPTKNLSSTTEIVEAEERIVKNFVDSL
jgi:hypothetical protein